jgi:tetratricopeptide (TPR) repeat protein
MPLSPNFRVMLFACLTLSIGSLNAQEKGLSPASTSVIRNTGKTRALVIGISDYQFIDKLNYAHKDAESFASFLYAQGLTPADAVVLTNKQATRANIITELLRMAQLSQPGDNLIFYFSGHGDVENITMFKKGYLLTNDTYSNNYMAGAISVSDLKDIFVTLCDRQVKVVVITDACRSGKLAGGKDGTQYTATLLKPLWSNEIKILSSEPDQLSMEGPQWGDGRGVFSYYLINGMEGAADANQDSMITINELNQFVGAKVSDVTLGKQQPIIDGPNRFSTVIVNLKHQRRANTFSGGNYFLSPKKITIPADSCAIYLEEMNKAILSENYLGQNAGAGFYYTKIKECSADKSLVLGANSRLLSAMLNTAQEIVNNSFSGKKMVSIRDCEYAHDLFGEVLRLNDLRLPYQKPLTNLQRYLKVISSVLSWQAGNYETINRILDSAQADEPDAAYIILARGIVELRYGNYTKAAGFLEKATTLGPGWLIPKFYLGVTYGYQREYRKAVEFYDEVLKKSPELLSFECAECIDAQMKKYRKRVNRINFEKFGNDQRLLGLDSIRLQLEDNVDSAYYFNQLALISNKKNHPKRDSVYYFLSQAVTLDPWEDNHVYSLMNYLYRESYGAREVRDWINNILKWRSDYGDDDMMLYLNETLIYSYISTKEYRAAASLVVKLFMEEIYSCNNLKKLKKHLSKEPEFADLLKECGL